MHDAPTPTAGLDSSGDTLQVRWARRYLNWIGWRILRLLHTVQGLGAFGLITLGVIVTKFKTASHVIHPLIRAQIHRAGVRLLPIVSFVALALGLVVIGQTVALLSRVGATTYAGAIMVTVVVRELGPLITALLVLARIGTAIVIELGTARALGEVEALEALGIDPIHYLVMPRVVGLALGIFSLTVYLILMALGGGYLFAFLQDVPLMPGDYFSQLATALRWEDFVLLALKTCAFGTIIAVVTCFHGLARPLRIQEVAEATTRAVVESLVACTLLDALFIIIYLLM
ncbi:MAG: ABC transporter permease [Verrucomicrobia bacterium]|nr:ABC transporter permease [Verrucomicrobiota bacterium]